MQAIWPHSKHQCETTYVLIITKRNGLLYCYLNTIYCGVYSEKQRDSMKCTALYIINMHNATYESGGEKSMKKRLCLQWVTFKAETKSKGQTVWGKRRVKIRKQENVGENKKRIESRRYSIAENKGNKIAGNRKLRISFIVWGGIESRNEYLLHNIKRKKKDRRYFWAISKWKEE